MKAHYLLALPVIALVVAASGCTIPGLGGGMLAGGKGIVIESFEPDFSQIYSTESAQLQLKVRNAGTVDGELKSVDLTGIDWAKSGTCTSLKGKMLPAVPDKGITGETRNCMWVVTPKQNEVPSDMSVTFYPVARVRYGYTTSTVKSITFGTSTELRSIQDRGGTLPADTISTTSGPVSIDIVSKGPIRVSQSGIDFPIELALNNAGGGIACKTECTTTDWNKVTLTIKLPDGITSQDGCENGVYTLWRGQSNTIGCRLHADGDFTGRLQKLITVTAEYDYIVDATTSLTVTGSSSQGVWV